MATIDPQTLVNVVTLACRAPSLHNSQPWRLIAEGGRLRLFLEPHRAPRATDQGGREVIISCGALLDHLRVAAAAAGWNAEAERFPNPNDLDHLATVDFHRTELVTDAARARADAILCRHTDRLPFAAPAGWMYTEPLLRNAVDPEAATLHILPDAARPQVAEASRLTEALRRYDTAYHAELHWWTALFEVSDGVPSSALAAASERDRVDVARGFPLSGHGGRRPEVDRDHVGEQRPEPLVLGLGMLHVADPGVGELDLDGLAQELLEQRDDLEQVGAAAERQVHRVR